MQKNSRHQNTDNNEKLTRQQQKSLHLFFRQVADELNKEGRTMTSVLQKFILEVPATEYLVKDTLWRPLQIALYGKKSTTELLKKQEIDKIYDALNKFAAEQLQMSLPPFPSVENNNFLQEYDNRKIQGN